MSQDPTDTVSFEIDRRAKQLAVEVDRLEQTDQVDLFVELAQLLATADEFDEPPKRTELAEAAAPTLAQLGAEEDLERVIEWLASVGALELYENEPDLNHSDGSWVDYF